MLLTLRFLKLLAVVVTVAGAAGAFLPRAHEERRRAALVLFAPGLGATWTLGFLLAQMEDVSLLAPWVLAALVLSFASLQVVLFSVARDGRRNSVTATLALAPLVATIALMVWRPS